MTLVCGTAGFDGTQFKNLLANDYNVQLNKTSRNSVLLQSNINNTRSDVAHLIRVLMEISRAVEARLAQGGDGERQAFAARVKSLMTDVPDLPNFSCFHDAFRHDAGGTTPEGDIRRGFYTAYDAAGCEHIRLFDKAIDQRLQDGPPLVSANFVIPYPPGFPIMVPGQVLTRETIDFMRKLDVKEIHGYNATEGLKLVHPDALAKLTQQHRSALNMFMWFATTLRSYPEIALFLSLAIGYYVGGFSYRGFALGAVTSTLLAAILIGQLGITISPNVKSVFFLIFLFAVGYGVGPQFVRGIASDGLPQALFAVVVCIFCLAVPVIVAKLAGYDVGYAAGLYAGSQTISASMGLATDAINRLGLAPDQTKAMLNAMPIAYAVTYIFGTVGSAILLAQIGPKLLGIDLVAACKAYEARYGGTAEMGGAGSAWHRWELRAFRVQPDGRAVGLTAAQAESLVPGARVFVQRIRRDGGIEDATADTVLQGGDIVAVAGPREVMVRSARPGDAGGRGCGTAERADRRASMSTSRARPWTARHWRNWPSCPVPAVCSCAGSCAVPPPPSSRSCRTPRSSAATS